MRQQFHDAAGLVRRNELLRRMLSTPPKPHAAKPEKKEKKREKPAK